ncbi:helix-loop-helix DNA-binding domain family protein [Aspergillus niger]|nr:helix-loop-helix DNA-binding domain family protein [Aspergillus niger]
MAGAKETSNTPQRGRRASKGCRTTGPVAAGGNNGLAGKENTLPHNNTGKRSQKGKSRGWGRDNIVRPEPADRDSRAGKTSRSGYRPLPGTSRVSSSEAPASDELSAAQMQVFLEAGLAMIDESPDTRRTFIESLATESGLRKVRQIVETDFAISYSVLKPMFDPHCILFFQLVSHNEVLSSLILEKAVGTIYNVIYGPGGRRAIGFFTKVTDYLTQFKSDGRSPAVVKHVATPSEVLSLVSRVLLGTLTLNHEAAIQVDLKKIADKLYDCCHADNADARAGDDNLQLAYENILKIQEIFSMGDSIPMSQKPDQVQKIKSNQQDSTRYIVDLPGELSDHGPRHDNDKTAISDIQILPTKSEILNADRPEFLPARCATGSANMHHEWGIRRLLDSQFRLLREDTSGVLREGIRLIIHAWELIVHGTDWRLKRKFLRDKMPTPVRVYSGVEIRQIKSEQFKGIEVNLEFDQLPRLKNVSPAKRKQWWFDSKALKKGPTLLALLDAEDVDDTSAIYFLVSKRETSYVDKDKQGAVTGDRVSDVVSDGNRAMVTLGLVGPPNPPDLERLVLFSRSKPFPRPLILVEFPAIPYNSFEGILRCLQVLHQNPARMPFTAWLAPSTDNHELCEALKGSSTDAGSISIQPPAYFHKDLLLDLSCLPGQGDIEDASQILSMSLSHDPRMLSADLSRATDLDEGQANAFIWALRRKIALIQGPPGTGKSYVGLQLARCLLHNKDVLDLGPILCVCYTAHALDQFLDGLLRSSVTNIIRIGPRSASPHIERLSLDMRKQEPGPRIKGLPRLKDESRVKLLSISSRIDELLKQAQSGCHSLVLGILKKRFPAQASRISSESPGETDTNALQAWVSGDAPGDWSEANIERSIDRLLQEDVWTLKASERTRLLNYWQEAALAEISQQVLTLLEAHSAEKERYTSAFSLSDVQRLNNCQVVGVTTTQLANNAELLRNLNAKVLICEEAAEVLESHVLTALIPSIQHAILIGDHLQLRPRISNLRLSMDYERENPKYNLDESLFERLANFRFGESTSSGTGGQNQQEYSFPVMQLSHQRRMHPSISELVRETLYPKLQDHPTMTSYPLVPGIARRLFWLDHCNVEDPTDPTEPMQSKTNTWEIGMVTALVRHLCQQGKYGPGEIAVLTPYVGQLRMLRNVLEKEMTIIISETDSDALDESEGLQVSGPCMNEHGKWCGKQRAPQKGSLLDAIRLATVDNFQGEEASVVIVSLVRSNRPRNCGFLKMPNRINSRQTWHVYNWRCKYGINRTHVVIRYSPAGKRRQYWPET